jgi:transposase, IS5 family
MLLDWFGLSDEGLEGTIHDSQSKREFVGIDRARQDVPDASTMLKFDHLAKYIGLTERMDAQISAHLSERGQLLRKGAMVDATIIEAPPSTKKKDKTRDPEIHQTKRRAQWHFGMMAHIGADAESGLVHSVHVTAANESDVAYTHELLHRVGTEVFAGACYTRVEEREETVKEEEAGDIYREVVWHVAAKRGKIKAMSDGPLKDLDKRIEYMKAPVRVSVELPFHVVNLFDQKKARYKGLAKNAAHVLSLFGWAIWCLPKGRCWLLWPEVRSKKANK